MKFQLFRYLGAAVLAAGFIHPLTARDAVEIHVTDDLQQVRVEALDEATNRWLAIASGYRDHADTGWLKVALPEGFEDAQIRVLGSETPSPFAGRMESARTAESAFVDYLPGGPESYNDAGRGGEKTVIEEADIWSWNGSTLYFYNQYRGLQVIDLADPAEPEWIDYFRYPAKGEDLYAFEDGTVILIGTGAYWSGDTVALQFLSLDGGALSLEETVELEAGQYLDSRRYGDFLYVMTREWERELNPDGQEINSPRIHLYTVALGEVTGERIIDRQSFDANGWVDAVLTAQQGGILICLNRWVDGGGREWRNRWRTEVNVLVPDENGIPELVGVAPLAGIIRDKFKLNFEDGLLTTISQQADWSSGQFSRATHLENFELRENGFQKIGALELAPGETLFASRFYEDAIYIVTFLIIDPLFAIDNSNPARPQIAGELEVPGWSDYIEWVDDQLFAVGIEDRRLTVSIFDVGDPANMSLKDRVFLNEDSWAQSEAQYDDQAISFFPDKRLLMLPFTTWSWESSEQIQAMQLISWDDTGLQLRGSIQHLDTPRRGTLLDDNVVTISGREVVVTDIADPDLPVFSGKETLAWNASWLIPHKDYLIQLEAPDNGGYGWYWRSPYNPQVAADPVLYVTVIDSPNVPAAEVPLDSGRLLGAALQDGRLVLLQDVSENPATGYWDRPDKQRIAVRLYDLADPLDPQLLDEALSGDIPYLANQFTPHMTNGPIVWSSDTDLFHGIYLDIWWPGPWGYGNNTLSYLVTSTGPGSTSVAINAYASFDPGGQWGNNSAWFWEDPLLLASQTSYTEHERPDRGYPDYKANTELVAVDFSIPYEPLRLPAADLPSNLAAVQSLRDGLNHILYFEPSWNSLEAWGWDQVNAFPLFKQQIGPAEWTSDSSYSYAWFPPFHARQRSEYENGRSTSFLDVWAHDPGDEAFEKIAEFSFENEWFQSAAEISPFFLLATNQNLHVFTGMEWTADGELPQSGWHFSLWESIPFPFPNIYNMQLADALLVDNAIYIPTGLYGVEVLPFSEGPQPLDRPKPYRQLSSDAGWTQLADSQWQRVPRTATTGAGALNRFNWLYRPDSLVEIDAQAVDGGDLWRGSDWFGWFAHRTDNPAWIQHLEHGLLYTYVGESPETQGIYYFDTDLGFVWTRADTYPWLYRHGTGEWTYYLKGSGAAGTRWFYGLTSGWEGF